MLLTMGISLFTSRVVLNTLGIEDFGIYNVVGGVIIMFSFINNAMASSTQRFLTFEIGKGDFVRLKSVFNTGFQIHLLIALAIVVLAETIGLWFLNTQLNIPPDRVNAAFWVYQFSILSSVIMILNVPYNALIIAHERMNIFAYISILDVVLKLGIVYLLLITKVDRLIFYAALILATTIIVRIIYHFYCKKHFAETKLTKSFDKLLFKEMFSFAGWNLFGNLAGVTFTQGLNILLNIFFSPVVNAARGVAVQVQSAVSGFVTNFQTALNPQITKAYATNDFNFLYNLIYKSSKYSFFLLLILTIPIFLRTDQILTLWLKNVPDHTVNFVRIMLMISLVDSIASPLMTAAGATGKIKLYQGVIGTILLLILPISYLALKWGAIPEAVFVVHLTIAIIAQIVRLIIIKPMIKLPYRIYFKNVVLPIILISGLTILPLFLINTLFEIGIWNLIWITLFSVFYTSFVIFFFGLKQSERLFFINSIKQKLL
jgi:O-antigen/teichoic acid export membrane protein